MYEVYFIYIYIYVCSQVRIYLRIYYTSKCLTTAYRKYETEEHLFQHTTLTHTHTHSPTRH